MSWQKDILIAPYILNNCYNRLCTEAIWSHALWLWSLESAKICHVDGVLHRKKQRAARMVRLRWKRPSKSALLNQAGSFVSSIAGRSVIWITYRLWRGYEFNIPRFLTCNFTAPCFQCRFQAFSAYIHHYVFLHNYSFITVHCQFCNNQTLFAYILFFSLLFLLYRLWLAIFSIKAQWLTVLNIGYAALSDRICSEIQPDNW